MGLWPIDDDLSYLSLMSQSHGDLLSWGKATVTEYNDFITDGVATPPFGSEKTYEITGAGASYSEGGTDYNFLEIKSPAMFNPTEDLNVEQRVFSVNAYVYHQNPVSFYEIAYSYNNEGAIFTERIAPGPPNTWVRIGRTFDHAFPPIDLYIHIKVYFNGPVSPVLINGVSVGQWSETHSSYSLGVTPIEIPLDSGLPSGIGATSGVAIREYGHGVDTGYVIVKDNKLLATNGGIPLVFGSNSVTRLSNGNGMPSIVVPGNGMLNENGRFNNYTLEAWIRVDTDSSVSRRIIGPVSSNDGIYIKGNSITLAIGDEFGSFCVGEWYRPMLVHMIVKDGEASMLVNGERVISIKYDRKNAQLSSNRLYNQDWIGLYSWPEVDVFEVDTVSIFPYAVPATVAKRRFVWGQGVESPETINSAYQGTAHAVDFAYANYSVNHSYPETARWDSGQTDGLVAGRYSLSAPAYSPPVVYASSRTPKQVFEYSAAQYVSGPEFITFEDYFSDDPCYLFFADSNKVQGDERVFYATFAGDSLERAPLFLFVDKVTNETLGAYLEDATVTYEFGGSVIHTEEVDPAGFSVGFDFRKMDQIISNFMAFSSRIELYVGGDGTSTYRGKIFRVGFCGEENSRNLTSFHDNGILNQHITDHKSNYVCKAKRSFDRYYLDVAVTGSWTEVFPLRYFASEDEIDFLQFNMSALSPVETDSSYVAAMIKFSRVEDRKPISFDTVVVPDGTGVLDLTQVSDLTSEAYLVTNQTTIVLPKLSAEGYSMTLRLDVRIDGVKTDGFVLRDMSIASVANASDLFMQIGTVHGGDIAPYTKVGHYYTNRVDRPWSIYKKSSPYLYLTDDSGVHPQRTVRESTEAGMWITMNPNKADDFKVSSLQMWVKFSDKDVPVEPVELFSVRSDRDWIRFMGVDDGTGQRVRVYSIDGYTGLDYTGIRFHQDGHEVVTPYIVDQNWTAFGIDFEPLLNLSSDIGAICLISSCVFNNIVFHRTSSLQEQYIFAYRTWAAVKNDGTGDLDWGFWKSEINGVGATWDQVSKTATISHGVSIDEIYKTYTGTNRVVIGDDTQLLFDGGTTTAISHDISENVDQGQTVIVLTRPPTWHSVTKKPV